jgi:hypothetical protein
MAEALQTIGAGVLFLTFARHLARKDRYYVGPPRRCGEAAAAFLLVAGAAMLTGQLLKLVG